METIKVYNARELKKVPHIELIKKISKSRTRMERGFSSLKLNPRHLGKNQYCILGLDWFLYYRITFYGSVEIELLESMNDPSRSRERTLEIIRSLKELLLAYPDYLFESALNVRSKRIYDLARKSGIVVELYFQDNDNLYFKQVYFRPSPGFIRENKYKEKSLDFKRVQNR